MIGRALGIVTKRGGEGGGVVAGGGKGSWCSCGGGAWVCPHNRVCLRREEKLVVRFVAVRPRFPPDAMRRRQRRCAHPLRIAAKFNIQLVYRCKRFAGTNAWPHIRLIYYGDVGNDGGIKYVHTNLRYMRARLVAIKKPKGAELRVLEHPARNAATCDDYI